MADNSFNSLLEILRERDIPYNRDALKSAFDSPEQQTAIQAWMKEYLSSDTLLTKEEAALYSTLVKNGEAATLAANQDTSVVRGLNDQEIQNAVEELKRSTASIEKQTEVLRLQQNAMTALVNSNTRNNQARFQGDKNQERKWDAEKGHISTAVEELSQSLKYQTSDLDQQSKSSESSLKQTVESILRSDDKLLSSLQKLASDLEPQREDDGLVERIRELCARLIKHTVEGIRTRLDRIYLDGLCSSKGPNENEDTQEVVDLQEELESLYLEILPVAQMSAEQQFLEPALREIAARDGQGQERSVKAVKYINDCLTFLTNRIEVFLERAEEHQSHKMALNVVVEEAKKEIQQVEPKPASKTTSPIRLNTQRRRKSSGSKSPIQVRPIRRKSSGHIDDDIEPEQQILRNLGVSIPADATSDQAKIEAFERALSDRLSKLEGHANSLQSTMESSISSHLLDAHTTLQLFQDSLLDETLYHKIQLTDPKTESSISTFENDLRSLQEKSEAADLKKLLAKNVNRERLIERWAR